MLPDAPDEDNPNVYRAGWCSDYPDSNNFLNDVFNSKSGQNYAKFFNENYDALVEDAVFEPDPDKRLEMYEEAERIFVEENTAITPIYYYTYVRLYKPWITPVINPVTGDPVAEWTVDWAAKKAAIGE